MFGIVVSAMNASNSYTVYVLMKRPMTHLAFANLTL